MVNASSIVLDGLMGVTFLSDVILSSSLASADDAVDAVTITVPTSCSMSSTGTNSHTAELGNGQSNSTIGETAITTYCNDNEGFAIYAIGYTGDTLGNTVLTDTSLGSTHDIVTGTATSGNTSNWAMKLSTITSPSPNFPITIAGSTNDSLKEQGDPDYSTFQAVPDDYTKVAYRAASTDTGTNAEGSTIKTTYQVYISPTQAAGTYEGKVKYVLVHPSTATAPSTAPSVTPPTSCTTPVPNLTYMQDLNSSNKASVLSSMTEDAQYFLADKRDDKTYCVAKLKDGNIWMTQNLDHDIDPEYNYTNENTDIGYNASTNSYDTASWTPVAATHATNDTEWREYDEDTNPDGGDWWHAESYNPGDIYWNSELNTYYSDSSNYISSTGNSHYHLGNYYNWIAAIAMNYANYYSEDNIDVNQSICPTNWTLSKGGNNYNSNGSFRYLVSQYGWNANSQEMTNPYIWGSPIKLALSGSWDGSLQYVGGQGYFWSSVFDGDYVRYSVADADGDVHPSDTDPQLGHSVRCLTR